MYSYYTIALTNPLYHTGSRDLRLVKYDNSRNPLYHEVVEFLIHDKTDFLRYINGEFICNDFNTLVHNHAQYLGFNCFLCFLYDFDKELDHACLAWDSLDYGRVFTDSTGVYEPDYSCLSYDKIITNVKIGEQAIIRDIETGYEINTEFIIGGIELF